MEVLQKYSNGNPDFGMPKISGLQLKNITVARASSKSPIQLNFKFIQLTSQGLEDSIIVNTSGWTKTPKNLEANLILPKLVINGDYETDGRILLLALDGKGTGYFEMTDNQVNIKVKVVLEKRSDGKNYIRIIKIKAVMIPKNLFIKMDNLVKGSPELSKTINDVINDNWSDVWQELAPGINNALAQIIESLAAPVFDKLSYDDFYVE
uniref:Hemolymph juvenile hormone binding protein (JHBP) n=1 Tax=Musca domestica TaxID=7370 RepID=T1PFS3_MUSDO